MGLIGDSYKWVRENKPIAKVTNLVAEVADYAM